MKMNKAYNMIDGKPLYKHLKNDSQENEITLYDHDYGKFSELLGKKMVNYLSKNGGFSEIFPGICILSIQKITSKKKKRRQGGSEFGDSAFELSYKDGDIYGNKIIIFEIKFGASRIKRQQFRRYCDMIDRPGEHFPKADEVKVLYIFFNKIDTIKGFASYQMCELDKEFVNKILQTEEQREVDVPIKIENSEELEFPKNDDKNDNIDVNALYNIHDELTNKKLLGILTQQEEIKLEKIRDALESQDKNLIKFYEKKIEAYEKFLMTLKKCAPLL
jgi:hypothetical protein